MLQYVARFLKRHIREADYVFRWGGDEFLVLITCGGDEAARKAAALKASFDAAPEAVELPPGIGLSVGWAEVPPGTTDLLPLVNEADARMYADKGRTAPVETLSVAAEHRRRRSMAPPSRIARRPVTSRRSPRRPSPSAARRRRRGSSSRRSCRTPGPGITATLCSRISRSAIVIGSSVGVHLQQAVERAVGRRHAGAAAPSADSSDTTMSRIAASSRTCGSQ